MMNVVQTRISIRTRGRESIEITDEVARCVAESGVSAGLCQVFIQHTSASLMITENADATVRRDLELLLARFAPDADPAYRHDAEGDDDMAAHARALLTGVSISIPVTNGELALGTWQGIFVYEHRMAAHVRHLVVTTLGLSPRARSSVERDRPGA